VVNRAQGWFPRGTRLGHTGTLDPLATGVLVLCAGQATRLTEYVQRMKKTYRAGFVLGVTSDTDDADGVLTTRPVERPPDRAQVEEFLKPFLGEIEQVPPAYSAAKVAGRRAYELARQDRDVELAPRRVSVEAMDVRAFEYPRLELEVRCGKGTYIRALARDLGERLGCGAMVQTLRRTRVGPFTAEDALSLDADAATARAALLPPAAAVAELPRLTVTEAEVTRLWQGQGVAVADLAWWEHLPEGAEAIAVFGPAGALVAVAVPDPSRRVVRPDKVLAT
jgi:tRNA pseudouridine55 synthase